MPKRVAKHVADTAISAIKEMAIRSAATPGSVSLAWGVPSFRTPEIIREEVSRQLEADEGIGMYSLPAGLPELREAAAGHFQDNTGIQVDPKKRVLVTAGNMQGVKAVLNTILERDEEVIVTDPGFASHIPQITFSGGQPVFWPLREDSGWALDLDKLNGLITPRTKAIILVSPSNPTGTIFPEDQLRRVGEIARKRNVFIILDDPYSHFTYEHRDRFFNLAAIPELEDHLFYLFSFSKAYAMSGWRMGYMVLPPDLMPHILKVQDSMLLCPPRISQVAALAGLRSGSAHIAGFQEKLAHRRALIVERLARLPHVFEASAPDGAYYIFPRIIAPHDNSFSFCLDVLAKAGVAMTPGIGFGPSGEHHVRMAYCVPEEDINTAFDRLETFFPK